jgi:hypothetical protein
MALQKNTNLTPKITKVYYSLTENVASVEKTNSDLTKQVTFNAGHTWNELYFTAGTASYAEPTMDDRSGTIYNQSLKMIYPGEDETNAATLYNINGRKMIVRLDYNNGVYKIIGDLERPARLKKDYSTDITTRNNIEVYCQAIKPAHFLYIS